MQNKFVKLVHLVGFITKKFVTMHGHMNLKFALNYSVPSFSSCHNLMYKLINFYFFVINVSVKKTEDMLLMFQSETRQKLMLVGT
jgi:hypothetical protein